MIATSFEQSNKVYDKPKDMSYEQCEALSTWEGVDSTGQPIIVSCWKCTKEELEEINRTGRVWCFIYGRGLPPHVLSGVNPFQ